MILKKASKKPRSNVSLLASLIDNYNITIKDKLECLKTLYTKWEYKDIKKVIEE